MLLGKTLATCAFCVLSAAAILTGGCSSTHGWAEADVYGTDGYRHRGYYDNHNDWHGGWYDNDRRYHQDSRTWRDRDWRDSRR